MMHSNRIQLLVAAAVLAAAVAGGWAATNLFQRTVPIVPGLQGCWRLQGSARQVACLSDEFEDGSDEAAGDAKGADRDEAVIEYVRRAERLAAADPRLAGTCHPAMHRVGRREGTRAAGEDRVPEFPGGSSQLCTAGYVHGLAEGYLTGTPSADVAGVFPKLCHDPASRTGCAHGVGHALLQAEGEARAGTVAGAAAALDRCEELPGEYPDDCFDGTYMELAMRTVPKAVPVETYADACRDASKVERELSCWGYLGLSLTANDVPIEDVPAWCGKATLPGQFPCIEGYGRDLGVERVADCAGAAKRPELQQRCVDGAVGLQVGSGHVSSGEAKRACGQLDDKPLRTYCTKAVGRYAAGRRAVEDGDAPRI